MTCRTIVFAMWVCAAGVLLVGDLVTNIRDGVQLAAQTIDSGAAKDRMESLIEISQAGGG